VHAPDQCGSHGVLAFHYCSILCLPHIALRMPNSHALICLEALPTTVITGFQYNCTPHNPTASTAIAKTAVGMSKPCGG
jgi:hypothetical protein